MEVLEVVAGHCRDKYCSRQNDCIIGAFGILGKAKNFCPSFDSGKITHINSHAGDPFRINLTCNSYKYTATPNFSEAELAKKEHQPRARHLLVDKQVTKCLNCCLMKRQPSISEDSYYTEAYKCKKNGAGTTKVKSRVLSRKPSEIGESTTKSPTSDLKMKTLNLELNSKGERA